MKSVEHVVSFGSQAFVTTDGASDDPSSCAQTRPNDKATVHTHK